MSCACHPKLHRRLRFGGSLFQARWTKKDWISKITRAKTVGGSRDLPSKHKCLSSNPQYHQIWIYFLTFIKTNKINFKNYFKFSII
jgi:hypothetical protein